MAWEFGVNLAEWGSIAAIEGLALSLALGLLIGVQRGWVLRNEVPGSRFAGIRTFGLIGLAGGLAGILATVERGVAVAIFGASALLIVAGYIQTSRRDGAISGTASLVGLLTLSCGYMATAGQALLATVAAVVVTLVLSLRSQLHGWIGRLSEVEVTAIARFALVALAILPLLPDRAYGPYDAWNPRQLWMVVVLVSGFSFAGYMVSKRLGPSRGTIAMAAAGAMVSSTAVTAALAARLRNDDEDPGILLAGIAAASVVMLARVLVLVAMIAPFAFVMFAWLVVPAAIAGAVVAALFLRASHRSTPDARREVPVRNPFDIKPALALMVLVMVLSLLSRWVLHRFGDAGLATVLALSGMVDVDSAIITMGGLPAGTLDARTAGLVLAAPIMLNTLVKAGITLAVAGWRRGAPAGLALGATVLAAVLMLPVVL